MFLRASLFVLSLVAIAQGERRVFGGHDVSIHEHPYIISFRSYNKYQDFHFCGGSIINKHWILTAAHCLEDRDINSFNIHAGTTFLNESGDVYEPKFYIIHEQYKDFYNYDIGLVRLKKEIVFTEFVQKIRLPTKDLHDYSKTAVAIGWGRTEWTYRSPNVLQGVHLDLLELAKCKKYWPPGININKRHICTSGNDNESICSGDSGGPLVMDGVQLGIASWGSTDCGTSPNVWTRVFSYRDWIYKKIQISSVSKNMKKSKVMAD